MQGSVNVDRDFARCGAKRKAQRVTHMCAGIVRLNSLVMLSVVLNACSAGSSINNTMNVDENLTTEDMNVTTNGVGLNGIAAIARSHNYDEKDGSTYEYISAVSEDDTKKGKAIGDVSTFAFRGVVNGTYRISSVDNRGRTQWFFECSKPCVVIKEYENGLLEKRLPYNPASVIGSAFEDALDGQLEPSKEPPPERAQPDDATASTYYSNPTTTTNASIPTQPAPSQQQAPPSNSGPDANGF